MSTCAEYVLEESAEDAKWTKQLREMSDDDNYVATRNMAEVELDEFKKIQLL